MRVSWDEWNRQVEQCRGCGLFSGCTQKVPGQGAADAALMLIGEGPGEMEDREGLAFVGPAGQLLTRMLAAISLPRDRVYICNIVKCRPPNNRQPFQEEAAACMPFLRAQVALVRPQVIALLGATAARNILGDEIRITRDRGRWYQRKGVFFMPTFHPSALLRDPDKKRGAWEDMKRIREKLIALGAYQDLLGGKDD